MIKTKIEEFKIDWIIRNKIAIGRPPNDEQDLMFIKKKGIR